MTLPVATLDHVVINARDDMDRAADIYRRLGFTLTERGYHSLGSMNHLAMFGTDYLELIKSDPMGDNPESWIVGTRINKQASKDLIIQLEELAREGNVAAVCSLCKVGLGREDR